MEEGPRALPACDTEGTRIAAAAPMVARQLRRRHDPGGAAAADDIPNRSATHGCRPAAGPMGDPIVRLDPPRLIASTKASPPARPERSTKRIPCPMAVRERPAVPPVPSPAPQQWEPHGLRPPRRREGGCCCLPSRKTRSQRCGQLGLRGGAGNKFVMEERRGATSNCSPRASCESLLSGCTHDWHSHTAALPTAPDIYLCTAG